MFHHSSPSLHSILQQMMMRAHRSIDDDDSDFFEPEFLNPPRDVPRRGNSLENPITVDDDDAPRSPGPLIEEIEDDAPELTPAFPRQPQRSPMMHASPVVHPRSHHRNIPIQSVATAPSIDVDDEERQMQNALKQSLEESERLDRKRERDELEAAYLESLEADRQKERQAEAERQQQQRELEKQRREELHKQAQAQRALSAAEEEKQMYAELHQSLIARANSLPPEPVDDADAFTVAVRLPGGSRVTRRFAGNTLLLYLKEWVDSELGKLPDSHNAELLNLITSNYELGTDFPKKMYSDLDQTLQELQLPKRVLLNIFPSSTAK